MLSSASPLSSESGLSGQKEQDLEALPPGSPRQPLWVVTLPGRGVKLRLSLIALSNLESLPVCQKSVCVNAFLNLPRNLEMHGSHSNLAHSAA